jgi:hypothetical protein
MQINFPPAFAKSWKTTALGLVSAALGFWQAYMIHSWAAIFHDPTTLALFALALLGAVSKDHNVTGGTSGQPSTPAALADANQAPAKGVNAPGASK